MPEDTQTSGLTGTGSKPGEARWLYSGDLATAQVEKLPADIAKHIANGEHGPGMRDIRHIWVSNVAGENVARSIREFAVGTAAQPQFAVASETQFGVRNGYTRPAQLGSDRWAALIAAWQMVRAPCLVVNSGTATTIDALSAQGEFTGGLIVPGVELMQRSLAGATDGLDTAQGAYAAFPLNSADAIRSGAIQASCGAIERQYALLDDDSVSLVLSGGAAAILRSSLNRKLFKAPPRVVDNLVLRGLLVMAQEANL